MTTATVVDKILHPRSEEELLEYERMVLELLAQAHGGRIELFTKVCSGELPAEDQKFFFKAVCHIKSSGVQFF